MRLADRRPGLVLTAALVFLVAGVLLALRASGEDPAGRGAAGLVPAGALAYVRLGMDPERAEDRRLAALAPRLPGYARLRDRALAALSPAGGLDLRRDVRPWLGDEVALALVDAGGGRFASVVLAQVARRPGAEALLQRVGGERAAARYRGTVLRRFGSGAAAFVDDFLVAGPEPAVRSAVDAAKDPDRALARSPAFRDALGAEDGRALQAYVSPRGLRGFGRAQGGVAGALAALLDHPGLRGLGAAASAERGGLRVALRRVGAAGAEFSPSLLRRVPGDAGAYAGVPSLRALVGAAGRLGAGPALQRLRVALPATAGVDLERDVLAPLDGEVAAWVSPGAAAPVLTLAARTRDPRRTREALARLQQPLAALLGGPETPQVFEPAEIAGLGAFTLAVTPALAPTYAVTADTVVASTAPAGLEAYASAPARLAGARAFRAALPSLPGRVEALGFIDPRQLLALGEQTGLSDGPLSDEAREDLRRVRAAAAVIEREETDTTAELFFEIP